MARSLPRWNEVKTPSKYYYSSLRQVDSVRTPLPVAGGSVNAGPIPIIEGDESNKMNRSDWVYAVVVGLVLGFILTGILILVLATTRGT